MMMRTLISPHADDAEIGASMLLLGADLLLVTAGHLRMLEQADAGTRARVHAWVRIGGGFIDGAITPSAELIYELERARSAHVVAGPPLLDTHQDHRAVAQAIRSALRRSSVTLLEYETPSVEPGWVPNLFIPMTADDLDHQADILSAFDSQIARPYVQRDYLEARARFRGLSCGLPLAQAFRLVSGIWGTFG